MTTKKRASFNSPKNRYRASVHFSKPIVEIGSSISATANNIDDLKAHIQFYIKQAHKSKATCYVRISENLKKFPEFDWKEIEKYNDCKRINNLGEYAY